MTSYWCYIELDGYRDWDYAVPGKKYKDPSSHIKKKTVWGKSCILSCRDQRNPFGVADGRFECDIGYCYCEFKVTECVTDRHITSSLRN